MDGTEKNFNVNYNKEKNSVEITSLTEYDGSKKLSGYSKKGNQVAIDSTQSIYLDDDKVTLQAYSVLDYNYCKLRDVAELLDFAVDWNENTNTVNIGTDRGIDESETIKKEDSKPNVDISTQEAIEDIVEGIGPGTLGHNLIKGHYDEKDWEQLVTNPYSSTSLSNTFDAYKKSGNKNIFEMSVISWLLNGGDDGGTHFEVFG